MACLDLSTQICLGLRLAHRALFDCSLPLAAMFAGFRRSCRNGKALFRHLLLHTARRWGWCSLRSRNLFEIGGANIENPPPSSSLAEERTPPLLCIAAMKHRSEP
jgi:hypothetical protein